MRKVELVYFSSCPHIDKARQAIRSAGISKFTEINLDNLDASHGYQAYSSPTILLNGNVVLGSQNGSSACSFVDWSKLELSLP